MTDLNKISDEVGIKDNVGNEFHEHFFEVVKLKNSLTRENISNYLETLKIYDSSPEELNRIKGEQLANTDEHSKALDKADDMIKKLKERISFYVALVRENNQGTLDIRSTTLLKFSEDDCSICKSQEKNTEDSASSVVPNHNIVNFNGSGVYSSVIANRDGN